MPVLLGRWESLCNVSPDGILEITDEEGQIKVNREHSPDKFKVTIEAESDPLKFSFSLPVPQSPTRTRFYVGTLAHDRVIQYSGGGSARLGIIIGKFITMDTTMIEVSGSSRTILNGISDSGDWTSNRPPGT